MADPVLEPYDLAADFEVRWVCPVHNLWVSPVDGCLGCVDDWLAEEAEHDEGLARMEGRL